MPPRRWIERHERGRPTPRRATTTSSELGTSQVGSPVVAARSPRLDAVLWRGEGVPRLHRAAAAAVRGVATRSSVGVWVARRRHAVPVLWPLLLARSCSAASRSDLPAPGMRERFAGGSRSARRADVRAVRGDEGQGGRRPSADPARQRRAARRRSTPDGPGLGLAEAACASSGDAAAGQTHDGSPATMSSEDQEPHGASVRRRRVSRRRRAPRRTERRPTTQLGEPGQLAGPGPGRARSRRASTVPQRGAPRRSRNPSPTSAHHVVGDRHPDQRGDRGERRAATYSPRVRCVAEHHREGALAGHRVGGDVAQVVGDQDRAGEGADPDGGVQRRASCQVSVWTYVVPTTATSPKNTKTITSPRPR